ncbi:MAG: glycosyltransferase [Rhodocyclaceae bacterium]
MACGARVAILMGCYNGASHLQEQLDSIAAQTHDNWCLVASDDGSSDATADMLAAFRARHGADRVIVRRGPGRGFLANFLSLACDPGVQADYYAFADQDDLWNSDKLSRALAVLSPIRDRPALYCGRTELIDDEGRGLGYSPLFTRPPCFRNALVQSLAGGNTMVFNEQARGLLAAAGARVEVPSHDWWLYLLVTGADGFVHYDPRSAVRYRQHGGNLVGGNVGWKARLQRLRLLMQGRFSRWNAMHCNVLEAHAGLLTPENRAVFLRFRQCRQAGMFRRLIDMGRIRLYRQTLFGNLGLFAAVLLRKF